MASVRMSVVVGLIATVVALVGFVRGAWGEDPAVTAYTVLGTFDGKEVARCRGTGGCAGKRITCPAACPTRTNTAIGQKACFINCKAPTCSATCRHRKLSCRGFGAVCYDPRFIGGDGVMFYFHGEKDKDFCLVSDKNININAHFIGKRPEGRTRDYTWVQALGVLFDSHKLSASAKKVAIWSDDMDQLEFSYDGENVALPLHEGALWTSPSGKVVIERTAKVNSVHVLIDQLMEVHLDVVPITAQDSKIHNYQITDDDCFAHLQLQFNFFGLSSSVDGVLGQTYRPEFKNPVKVGVPMPIMGGDRKFSVSSLLAADSLVNQFSPAPTAIEKNPIHSFPIKCSNNGEGFTCRR